jgi:dipeptidyl aminopeptidase/acylaminoacyl peptidase
MNKRVVRLMVVCMSVSVFFSLFLLGIQAAEPFSPQDVLNTRTCADVQIGPNGQWIAYTVNVPRSAGEEPGSAYRELYLVSPRSGLIKPFITGKVNINHIRWSPDGSRLGFITRRGEKAKNQVWVIPVDGGEAVQVTHWQTSVYDFAWHPDGKHIAFLALPPASKRERALEEKGYGFIFYEENLKHRTLYLQGLNKTDQPVQLTTDKTVWSFTFSPDGKTIAAAASKQNMVDHRYMFQKVYLLDIKTKTLSQLTDNPGKLGNFEFSPDGSRIAYTAALERKDHAVSQVYVIDIKTKESKNLTIPDFRGHVTGAGWKDNNTVVYQAGEGVWSSLSLVNARGGQRTVILDARETGITFRRVDFTDDFKHFAFGGSAADIPGDVFYWRPGRTVKRLTRLNTWLPQRQLGKQEVMHYPARDGQEIEGLLIYPLDFREGKRYPLIVTVHGGPEAHYYNSWLTRYATPGQVLSGRGYLVFYPNYRASTGYGVKFALAGYEDPAGKEFDDIADGIDYLVEKGLADPGRVGLGGGSYGGYAAAWFATYYTKYVRAVCMFVGISDLISKRGTTDIPYEELYVHSGSLLEQMWDLSLKRSPIYWAHRSKTATLIIGGADDPRVHPSQSLELYRRLKMNHHPAVRLVQYPGEGHGNRKQPGRIDVLYRVLQWYDWYVMAAKPLDGPLPPLDISDRYGLNLED